MSRMRAPTEFGFTTAPYIPPERTRPLWRTLLMAALIALIPIVGPGMSAVYVDRRGIPSTFSAADAVKTAVIQVLAVGVLVLVVWAVLFLLFGFTVTVDPRFSRT